MKIQTTIDIDDQVIIDVLTTAIEGGSNYWYEFREEANDIVGKYVQEGKYFVDWLWDALKNGESIPVHDVESDYEELPLNYLSLDKIKWGTELMANTDQAPDQFAMLITEEVLDANDADTAFQYWVLGEIVYG